MEVKSEYKWDLLLRSEIDEFIKEVKSSKELSKEDVKELLDIVQKENSNKS